MRAKNGQKRALITAQQEFCLTTLSRWKNVCTSSHRGIWTARRLTGRISFIRWIKMNLRKGTKRTEGKDHYPEIKEQEKKHEHTDAFRFDINSFYLLETWFLFSTIYHTYDINSTIPAQNVQYPNCLWYLERASSTAIKIQEEIFWK